MLSLKECAENAREYGFTRLLSLPGHNSKFAKAIGFYNAGLSLSPAKSSGHNVCPDAGLCIAPCVAHRGRAEHDPGTIRRSRIGRTRLLFQDPGLFAEILRTECRAVDRKARRLGIPVAFRPNTFSDLDWPKIAPWLFEEFPAWHFYGYTKVRSYARRFQAGQMPENYHLTFSWSENIDVSQACELVESGINVAVPFYDRETLHGMIPGVWNGIPVIDGDSDDLRFQDPRGVFVGLKVKLPKSRAKALKMIQRSQGFFVGI